MENINNIYLDHAATTPVDEQVLEAMLPYFSEIYGNPSSIHYFGQQAEHAVDRSRRTVAGFFNAQPGEIYFTGCGTESDNLALRGVCLASKKKDGRNHILISPVEHHAVTQTALQLVEEEGFKLDLLPVNEYGEVDPQDIEARLLPETALVSVVYANNEIGTINPVSRIGAVCRQHGVYFHTDAVQAAAHLPINVVEDHIDLMAVGAHKFYGPKGVGVLYARKGVPIFPIITGGKQEMGYRAGTENVPYIVGLAKALELSRMHSSQHSLEMAELRDHLIMETLKRIPRAHLTGHPVKRLPNHASFVFENVDGNKLLMILDAAGFSCSSGSACKVGSPKPSEVLLAIGLSKKWALGSLRVTLGRGTTREHIDRFILALPGLVEKARIL